MKGKQHFETVRSLLGSQRFTVLSTRQADGQPYASLVAFQAAHDLTQLVFCTLRTTRKFANLQSDGRVALLVDNRENRATDLVEAAAVTVLGRCEEALGDERLRLVGPFLLKHPDMAEFVESPGCAVMRVDVDAYYLVTRFQNVIELHMEDGRANATDPSSD